MVRIFGSVRNALTIEWYRFTEMTLTLDEEIYVLGTAAPCRDRNTRASKDLMVRAAKRKNSMLLTDMSAGDIFRTPVVIRHLIVSILFFLIFSSIIFIAVSNYESAQEGFLMYMILFIAAVSLIALIPAYGNLRWALSSKRRKMPDIYSMEPGPVKVKGVAKPVDDITVISPFTGKRCLAYTATVERLVGRRGLVYTGRPSITGWAKIATFRYCPKFYIENYTGRIPVNPMGAVILSKNVFQLKTSNLKETPKNVQKLLRKGMVNGIRWREDRKRGY